MHENKLPQIEDMIMSDAVLQNENLGFKILSLFHGLKMPDFEAVINRMFEQMPVPPAFNYIGNLNKNDVMY